MRARATEGTCMHYNGTVNARCDAGVTYEAVRINHEPLPGPHRSMLKGSIPCMAKYNPGGATCPQCQMPTPEQVAATKADDERRYDLMRRGLSSCCEAPIDERAVIREGRHKGHGPRYCSKCGRCVFIV